MDMNELYNIVVNECYCIWSLFLENVANKGWTQKQLKAEAAKCKGREELIALVNKFI